MPIPGYRLFSTGAALAVLAAGPSARAAKVYLTNLASEPVTVLGPDRAILHERIQAGVSVPLECPPDVGLPWNLQVVPALEIPDDRRCFAFSFTFARPAERGEPWLTSRHPEADRYFAAGESFQGFRVWAFHGFPSAEPGEGMESLPLPIEEKGWGAGADGAEDRFMLAAYPEAEDGPPGAPRSTGRRMEDPLGRIPDGMPPPARQSSPPRSIYANPAAGQSLFQAMPPASVPGEPGEAAPQAVAISGSEEPGGGVGADPDDEEGRAIQAVIDRIPDLHLTHPESAVAWLATATSGAKGRLSVPKHCRFPAAANSLDGYAKHFESFGLFLRQNHVRCGIWHLWNVQRSDRQRLERIQRRLGPAIQAAAERERQSAGTRKRARGVAKLPDRQAWPKLARVQATAAPGRAPSQPIAPDGPPPLPAALQQGAPLPAFPGLAMPAWSPFGPPRFD